MVIHDLDRVHFWLSTELTDRFLDNRIRYFVAPFSNKLIAEIQAYIYTDTEIAHHNPIGLLSLILTYEYYLCRLFTNEKESILINTGLYTSV